MEIEVLQKLIESKSDYFIIESYKEYEGFAKKIIYQKLILISLPQSIKKIISEHTIDTITVKESEFIKRSNIDTNIYIYPKYPPFQLCQQVFYYAIDILPIEKFDLVELLQSDAKTISDVKQIINKN